MRFVKPGEHPFLIVAPSGPGNCGLRVPLDFGFSVATRLIPGKSCYVLSALLGPCQHAPEEMALN